MANATHRAAAVYLEQFAQSLPCVATCSKVCCCDTHVTPLLYVCRGVVLPIISQSGCGVTPDAELGGSAQGASATAAASKEVALNVAVAASKSGLIGHLCLDLQSLSNGLQGVLGTSRLAGAGRTEVGT